MTVDAIELSQLILRDRGVADDGLTYDEALAGLTARVVDEDARYTGRDDDFRDALVAALSARRIIPGTPLLSAGRTTNPQCAAACTVVPDDDRAWFAAADALAQGVGVGLDFGSRVDPVASLKEINARVLELDDELRAHQRRPVAAMGTVSSDHPEVARFIRAKRQADFARWRFNISIKLVGGVESWGHLLNDLAATAHYCAEPGILFWDRFERDNPLPHHPPLSTAPCAEVALAPGESCTFAYLDLASFWRDGVLQVEEIEESTRLAVRMLDAAVDLPGDMPFNEVSRPNRRVGVGVMGFADLCILAGLRYGDAASTLLARQVSAAIAASAYETSAELSARRGPFAEFSASRYTDRTWLERTLHRMIGDVDAERAARIVQQVQRHGVRHSRLVAFPPTGNSSRIVGTSQAVEPRRTRVVDSPQARDALRRAVAASPHIDITDHEVTGAEHVAVQAAFQRSSLDSVSKTVNMANDVTTDDVSDVIRYADELDCKGVTIFRDGCLDER